MEMGPWLRVSSDRLRQPGARDRMYKASRLSNITRRLLYSFTTKLLITQSENSGTEKHKVTRIKIGSEQNILT